MAPGTLLRQGMAQDTILRQGMAQDMVHVLADQVIVNCLAWPASETGWVVTRNAPAPNCGAGQGVRAHRSTLIERLKQLAFGTRETLCWAVILRQVVAQDSILAHFD